MAKQREKPYQEQWNVYFGYSQFETEDPDGEKVTTTSPKHQVKLFTTYELDNWVNGLQLGAGVNWQSEIRRDVTKPDRSSVEVSQQSYGLVRLMARYNVNDQLTLRANLDNAFDKRYYSQLGFYNQFQYGAPRNFSITAQYSF